MKEDLKIVVLDNIKDLGDKINNHLKELNNTDTNYIIKANASRFSNGEGKIMLEESVRSKDIYILSDVGNYGITYKIHGMDIPMSPDEHFQDIKRVISATGGYADRISLITPLLYQSRQHKRKEGESLDCALALQELEHLGINGIITFDAHDPNVCNAIPNTPFDNFFPTHTILNTLIDKERNHIQDLFVIAPDKGAVERARYYADMLGCEMGMFEKRRDHSKIINGKNPIIKHSYMGQNVKGKNIIVVDDMIASGQSMIDVAKELKKQGANSVFLIATFALLTEGPKVFEKAYEKGYFNKLYSTNLSYVPKEIKNKEWYKEVDCSYFLANIIKTINEKGSIKELNNGKEEILQKVRKLIK